MERKCVIIGFVLCLQSYSFAATLNDINNCTRSTSVCAAPFIYCGYLFGPNGYQDITCVNGLCRCPENAFYDYCTCLPHIGSCLIKQDSASIVGTPTTDGYSETTYGCVASDNCNYEVHVIGNYESSNGRKGESFINRVAGDTDVIVSVSGESPRPLILVLTSYEPVRWRLSVTSGVIIDRVILSGHYVSTVTSSPSNAIRQTETLREPDNHSGYGFDNNEEGTTAKLLLYLQQRFGPVTSFSGSYSVDRWELNIHRASGCSYNNKTRNCRVPSAPENGTVNVTGVQPIVAKYSCHEGTLVGPEMRTCLGNGSWSGNEPACRTGNVCTQAPIRECPDNEYCGNLPSSNDDYTDMTCGEDNDCRCPEIDYYDNCTCLPHIGSCLIEKNSDSNIGTPTSYGGGQETTYTCVASDNCNYEVHVIGNWMNSNGRYYGGPFINRVAGDTDVVVSVSGESPRPLILVLTSYEVVRWRLSVTSGVIIDRVIVSGYCVGVTSSPSNAIKQVETLRGPDNYYGYGTDHEGGGTSKILLYLQHRFGPVTSFSGSYRADRWELNIHRTSGCSFNNKTRSCPVPFVPRNGAVNVTGVQPIVAKYSCHEGTLDGPEIRTCLESGSWSGEEPSCTTDVGPEDRCREGEFRCADGSGTCYPLSFVCDGYSDCSDGSDEEHCDIPVGPGDIICGEGEFRCPDGSGTCYPLSIICDGYSDCSDGSDEEHCDIFELTSPSDLSMDEGAVESFTICLTVMEEVEGFISKELSIDTFPAVAGAAKDEIDYTFSNQTITFAGNYSLGDSECAVVNVTTINDNIVEGTEVISVFITARPTATLSIFIIDDDYLEVGFESESLSVSESAGGLEIAVRVFPNENGIIPGIGKPFGLRVTSKDGSAVAGMDYQRVLSTVYFRLGENPVSVLEIRIIDDGLKEGNEEFALELTSFDLPVVLVNSVLKVVLSDNDDGCPDLTAPADGSVHYTRSDVGSQANYSCTEGYTLVGMSTRVCQNDGTWSGQSPLCQSEVCTVELDGQIEVTGNSATYSFSGVGTGISGYICKLDGVVLPDCLGPLTGLSPGLHRLRVVPVGCSVNQGATFQFAV